MKRVAVTGASGMLGRHILKALSVAGFEAIPFGRAADPRGKGRVWDLLNWKGRSDLDLVFRGVDAIVHSAALVIPSSGELEFRDLFDANVRACAVLGEWARQSNVPVVYVSSASVYENPDERGIRETASVGWSGLGGTYALSKILAEDVFGRLRYRGLKVAMVRPSSLYGFGEPARRLVSKFLGLAASGERIELSPPFDDAVDLVHAADVARAITGIVEAKCWAAYNVASGAATTVSELAELCVAIAGRGSVTRSAGATEPAPAKTRFLLNCEAASRDFGYSSAIDLTTGVRAVYDRQVISVPR